MYDPRERDPSTVTDDDPNSLGDLHQELRILLQGSQVLAGFLVVLPFSARFGDISPFEKWVYLAAFLSTTLSIVLFSAPAIHHRLQRPLVNRIQFKNRATRMMLIGGVTLSLALSLATQVAVSEIVGDVVGSVVAAGIAAIITFTWWVFPTMFPNRAPEGS